MPHTVPAQWLSKDWDDVCPACEQPIFLVGIIEARLPLAPFDICRCSDCHRAFYYRTEPHVSLDTEHKVVTRQYLRIDEARRVATSNGELLHLSRSEFDVLNMLAKTAGPLSTDAIATEIYHYAISNSERMLVHNIVYRIRKKLEPATKHPAILGVHKRGYVLKF